MALRYKTDDSLPRILIHTILLLTGIVIALFNITGPRASVHGYAVVLFSAILAYRWIRYLRRYRVKSPGPPTRPPASSN